MCGIAGRTLNEPGADRRRPGGDDGRAAPPGVGQHRVRALRGAAAGRVRRARPARRPGPPARGPRGAARASPASTGRTSSRIRPGTTAVRRTSWPGFVVSDPEPFSAWVDACDELDRVELQSAGRALEIVKDLGDSHEVAAKHGVRGVHRDPRPRARPPGHRIQRLPGGGASVLGAAVSGRGHRPQRAADQLLHLAPPPAAPGLPLHHRERQRADRGLELGPDGGRRFAAAVARAQPQRARRRVHLPAGHRRRDRAGQGSLGDQAGGRGGGAGRRGRGHRGAVAAHAVSGGDRRRGPRRSRRSSASGRRPRRWRPGWRRDGRRRGRGRCHRARDPRGRSSPARGQRRDPRRHRGRRARPRDRAALAPQPRRRPARRAAR